MFNFDRNNLTAQQRAEAAVYNRALREFEGFVATLALDESDEMMLNEYVSDLIDSAVAVVTAR